jgi:hypothetical protein
MRTLMIGATFSLWSNLNATENERIDKFLVPFVRREAAKQGDSGTWNDTGNGGYVFRFVLDVTGDGKDEVFISCSLASFRSYAEWEVFSVGADGALQPYAERIQLSIDSIWLAGDKGRTELVQEFPPPEEEQRQVAQENWKYPILRYSFDYPTIQTTKEQLTRDEIQELRRSTPVKQISLKAVSASDYVVDPASKWVDIKEWRLNSHGYFIIPHDRGDETRISTFTPEFALKQLEARLNSRKKPVSEAQIEPKERLQGTPGSGEEVQDNARQIWILGVASTLLAMAAYLAVKRRRSIAQR